MNNRFVFIALMILGLNMQVFGKKIRFLLLNNVKYYNFITASYLKLS